LLNINVVLESNSIVEKEGWEIRWAKPIGASKILERQRYIREAVASTEHKSETSRPKRGQGKKNCVRGSAKAQEDDNVSLAQMRVLQNFVRERYNAVCDFDCIAMSDMSKYVGKVSECKSFQVFILTFTGRVCILI